MQTSPRPSFHGLAALLLAAFAQTGLAMDEAPQPPGQLVSGNTLVVKNWFGPTLIQFHADQHFQQLAPNGRSSAGNWRATEDSVCLTVTTLPPGREPREYCLELQGRALGSAWEGPADPRNGPISYQLLQGHPDFKQLQ